GRQGERGRTWQSDEGARDHVSARLGGTARRSDLGRATQARGIGSAAQHAYQHACAVHGRVSMARDRYRRSARGNRWGLALIGVLLLVIGLVALAVGQGLFGGRTAGQRLLGPPVLAVLGQQWVPYVAVAVALVPGFLAVRWVMAQGLDDTVGLASLDEAVDGYVTRGGIGARRPLKREVTDYPGVRRARAHLTESTTHPRPRLAPRLEEAADVNEIRQRVRPKELANLRNGLD